MTSGREVLDNEQHRLSAATSVVTELRRHVVGLTQVPTTELTPWLAQLRVPPSWQTGQAQGFAAQPSRIAVCGQRPEGGWNGCETLSVFRFTGSPPAGLLHDHADCILRDLNADSITTYPLTVPTASASAEAVRSSGYFTIAGRRLWAQYSTYLASDYAQSQGVLVHQVLFIESEYRADLRDDIADLSDEVHQAFVGLLDTVDSSNDSLPDVKGNRHGPQR